MKKPRSLVKSEAEIRRLAQLGLSDQRIAEIVTASPDAVSRFRRARGIASGKAQMGFRVGLGPRVPRIPPQSPSCAAVPRSNIEAEWTRLLAGRRFEDVILRRAA